MTTEVRFRRAIRLGLMGCVLTSAATTRAQQAPPGPDLPVRTQEVLIDEVRGVDLNLGELRLELMSAHPLGMVLNPVDPVLRAQLKLSEDHGLIVTGVVPDSPAAAAGIQKNDIVLGFGDDPVKSIEDFNKRFDTVQGENKATTLRLLRGGKTISIEIRPGDEGQGRAELDEKDREAEVPAYWIGVAISPVNEATRAQLVVPEGQGLVVADVVPDSPAANAGVEKFDLLLSVEGQNVADLETLMKRIGEAKDTPITLHLLRGGEAKDIQVTPERRKADTPRPRLPNRMERMRLIGPGVFVAPGDGRNAIRFRMFPAPIQPPVAVPPGAPFPPVPPGAIDARLDQISSQLKELDRAIENLRKQVQDHPAPPTTEAQP